MGRDKALLNYHGQAQQYHLYDLLTPYCNQVFISCRASQASQLPKKYAFIKDKYHNIGPLNGLLSAFESDNESRVGEWLVVACDMPYIHAPAIEYLIQNRQREKIATCFRNSAKGFAEPLFTIWEASSYPILKNAFLTQQYSLRKILQQHAIRLLTPPDDDVLKNVNYLADYQKTFAVLCKNKTS